MSTATYDPKVSDLAEQFLSDESWFKKAPPEHQKGYIDALATLIQEVIESEIANFRDCLHVDF